MLATCVKWLKTRRDTPAEQQGAQIKKYLANQVDMEEGRALFCMCHSLTLSDGLLYLSTTPKGELGVLAFLVPASQQTAALNGVRRNVGHQGQQQTLALVQECFWWPMMVEDCRALVHSCPRCRTFEGVILKVPLCPIRHTLH